MGMTAGILVVVIIGAIIFLSQSTAKGTDHRKKYLEALGKFLEVPVEELPEYENSFRLRVDYEKHPFEYWDIEDKGFQTSSYRGILRIRTISDLTLSFIERAGKSIRSNISSFSEYATVWATEQDAIRLPKPLRDFKIYTNNPQLATVLVEDDRAAKLFARYKNVDPKGRPIMSLDIVEGVITLRFHEFGDLTPSLLNLRNSPSSIEGYMDDLLVMKGIVEEHYEREKDK